jgi:hypothetical protein
MKKPDPTSSLSHPPSKGLSIALWTAQGLLALTFVGGAIWKLVTPIGDIVAVMPWAGQVSRGFFYATAVFDLLGGFGILLPSLTRIWPRMTLVAALGCVALMVSAIVFHFSRGEAANTPFNFALIGLLLFVFWGRRGRAQVAPRE